MIITIVNFIYFIYGSTDEQVETMRMIIIIADVYAVLKEKQMTRDSHETKTVIKKRKSIARQVEQIREANRLLVAEGLPPKFNSPSRLVADLVAESPPFHRQTVNSRRLGQHQGVSSSTYAVYEDNTVWSGVTNSTSTCQTITKTTKVTLPGNNTERGDMITADGLRIIHKKAAKVVSVTESI